MRNPYRDQSVGISPRMIRPKGFAGQSGDRPGSEDERNRGPEDANTPESESALDQALWLGREPHGTPYRWAVHRAPRRRLRRRNTDPRCRSWGIRAAAAP